MRYLRITEITSLHRRLIAISGGADGLREAAAIEAPESLYNTPHHCAP